jgi:hypothetical protein
MLISCPVQDSNVFIDPGSMEVVPHKLLAGIMLDYLLDLLKDSLVRCRRLSINEYPTKYDA